MNSTIKAIGISGSLRSASTNTGLLRSAQANLPEGMALEILDINAVPFYNADYDIERSVRPLLRLSLKKLLMPMRWCLLALNTIIR